LERGSERIDIVPRGETLVVERNLGLLSPALRRLFDERGVLRPEHDPDQVVAKFSRSPRARISQDVDRFLEARRRGREKILLRREYENGVVSGKHPEHVTLSPLYPYQREGMLHLAFGERSLLADEMGLGKTIQAIAACALLHHLGKAKRVLVVTPASLKGEWEEQIGKFTALDQRLVYGGRVARAAAYAAEDVPFFTIVNHEQVVRDSLDINQHLRPDIVVLDEAQRIKNWVTKTAQAVKRLESRYAFVLTGTPIENRIDELYSIVDYLDPSLLGSLFRFNREFYELDDRGRPKDYRNLPLLRERVKPVLLRRRKWQVETELPDRTERNHLVKLTAKMRMEYEEISSQVAELVARASKRALTKREQELLMVFLAMMRMICDSPSIIKKRECQDCPKLEEMAKVVEEVLCDPDVKIVIFSEWEGMLKRVRGWAESQGIGYAWHTGSVDQKRRRGEVQAFRQDPNCRLFLSTDSGGVGLNLQNASVVINCDLPWNPARLEQRIARAWRKNKQRSVTVVNLVAEDTIEQRMLDTLASKAMLAEGVLDGVEESLRGATLKRGVDSHLARLRQMSALPPGSKTLPSDRAVRPADPALAFAEAANKVLGAALVHCDEAILPGQSGPAILAVLAQGTIHRASTLERVHQAIEWSGDKRSLHVIEESTWSAIRKLVSEGLLSFNTRATRSLVGTVPLMAVPPPPPLTAEQLHRIESLRVLAKKKLRVAELLAAEGMEDEAAPHRRAAERALEQAGAIENRREDAGDFGGIDPANAAASGQSPAPAMDG
jgi:arsenate reductase-like glutaredoxin family protein